MTLLEYPTYLDHIRTESARFREVLTDCDPTARVPTCPEWDAADLLWHLGEVQWFWASSIRVRPATIEDARVERPHRPTHYAELLETFDAFSRDLVTELERADPAEPAYHWSDEQTVGASYSRQAHEALIHRLDAEQTAGAATAPIDAALAADGVREVLELMRGGDLPDWITVDSTVGEVVVEMSDTGASLRVRPARIRGTDPDSAKTYDEGHLLPVEPADSAAAVVVSAPAAYLDAWLWNRRDDAGIRVVGDRATYDAFVAAAREPIE